MSFLVCCFSPIVSLHVDVMKYSNEFYSFLPHNVRGAIASKKAIAQKQDICQVIVMQSVYMYTVAKEATTWCIL